MRQITPLWATSTVCELRKLVYIRVVQICKAKFVWFFVCSVGFVWQWQLAKKSLNGAQDSREQNLRLWQWTLSLHQSIQSLHSRELWLLRIKESFFSAAIFVSFSASFTVNQDLSASKPQTFFLPFFCFSLIAVSLDFWGFLVFKVCVNSSCPWDSFFVFV